MQEKVRAKNATLNGVVFSEQQCWAIKRCAKDVRNAIKMHALTSLEPEIKAKRFNDPTMAVILADILRKQNPGKTKVIATDFGITEATALVIRMIARISAIRDPEERGTVASALKALLAYANSQESVALKRLERISHPTVKQD